MMTVSSRWNVVAVVTGVMFGLVAAYIGASVIVDRSLELRKLEQSKDELTAWNKASSAGTMVAYRAYVARFPGLASKAEGAIQELVKKRSPAFKNVNRVRLIVRQSYGGAKVSLPIRETAAGWLSLAGLTVCKDGDPRYDVEMILNVQGKALSEVYTFRSKRTTPGFMPFSGADFGGERATRYAGAIVKGDVSFVGSEGPLEKKQFFYRINPPESLTVTTRNSFGGINDDTPENAPFLSALEKSLAPTIARIMAENFGKDILGRGAVSGESLIKVGAEAEKAKR